MPQMMPYMVPQQGYGMSAYAMGQTQSMGYMTSYPQQVYYPQSAVPMTAPVNPATPATPIAQVYRSGVSEIGERNVAPFPAQVGTKNVNTNGVENMISKSPIKSPYASVTTSNTSTPANRLTDCETDLSNMSIEGKDESSNRDSGASDESLLGISRRVDGFSNSMQSPTKLQRFKTHPGNNPQQQYQQSQVQYQQQSLQQHQQQQYYAQQQSLQQQQPHIQQQQQKPGSASTRPPITSRSRSADSDVTSSPSYKQSYQQQPQPQQQPQYAQSVSSHGYQQQNPQSYNAAIYSYASMPQTQTVMYTYENGVAHPVVYQQPGVAPRAMYMAGYGPVAYPADGSYAQQSGTAQQQQQFAYYQQQSVAGVSHSVAPTAGTGTATGTATAGAQRSQQPGTAYYNKIPVSRQTGYGGRSSQSPSQPQFQTQPQQLQTLGSIANRTVSASPQR